MPPVNWRSPAHLCGVRGFESWEWMRLLAAIALQKIHWVHRDCVSTDGVGLVVHGILLRVFVFTERLPVGLHYITRITRMSFHYI